MVNYANIGRDCGVDAKSVKEYFQILQDTLLGTMLDPFKLRQERQVISKAPKFYFFDVGVAGYLTGRRMEEEKGEMFGRAFEHFILMELLAYRSYTDLDFKINFWRTKAGQEVDFVLADGDIAIEVKGTSRVDSRDVRSLNVFNAKYSPQKSYLVNNEKRKRLCCRNILIPWKEFLTDLWNGDII